MAESVNGFFGRRKIYTDADEITAENVVDVLIKAVSVHNINAGQIDMLYRYYCGNQPILNRTKDVRPEICNRVVENRAIQIVQFKDGYLTGEPVQYVSKSKDTSAMQSLLTLNAYMSSESKAKRDAELVHWFHICGTAYRIVLPDADAGSDPDEAPFEIRTLEPRCTFVVYHNGMDQKPMMGVTFVREIDSGQYVYSIYTRDMFFKIRENTIIDSQRHTLGAIPIIEYPANEERMGAFEPVLPILDAINEVSSNRIDGIDQFIQALMVFKGVDIDDDTFKSLKEQGAIKIPADGDVDILSKELNQQQVQTLKDDLWNTALEIVGLPNRNGGSSTSDTGTAVIYRDGWSTADSIAKTEEQAFDEPEIEQFLPLVLNICNKMKHEFALKLSDVEVRFTRRNYENISGKSTVLISMLNNDKIAPKLAFESCGMFPDPAYAQEISEQHEKQVKKEEQASLMATAGVRDTGASDNTKTGSDNGSTGK